MNNEALLSKNFYRSFFKTSVVSSNTEKVTKEKTNRQRKVKDDQDGEHRIGRSGLWGLRSRESL